MNRFAKVMQVATAMVVGQQRAQGAAHGRGASVGNPGFGGAPGQMVPMQMHPALMQRMQQARIEQQFRAAAAGQQPGGAPGGASVGNWGGGWGSGGCGLQPGNWAPTGPAPCWPGWGQGTPGLPAEGAIQQAMGMGGPGPLGGYGYPQPGCGAPWDFWCGLYGTQKGPTCSILPIQPVNVPGNPGGPPGNLDPAAFVVGPSVQITITAQKPLQVNCLRVPSSIAANFFLTDISVAGSTLLAQGPGLISMESFSTLAATDCNAIFAGNTLMPGQQIQLSVAQHTNVNVGAFYGDFSVTVINC